MTIPNSESPSQQSGNIEFPPPLARGSEFPSPVLSMLPTRTDAGSDQARPLPTNTADMLPVAWARNGLALIAQTLIAQPLPATGHRVLLPAYHCPALVEPFIWAGWNIDFYPMAPDLSPDMDYLEANLAAADILLVVPFFGYTATEAAPLRLARERGCTVIEDLAHAAFKQTLDGDFGVTSLQKFYPVESGGEILLAPGTDAYQLRSAWRSTMSSEPRWALRSLTNRIVRKIAPRTARHKGEDDRENEGEQAFRYFDPAATGEPMRQRDRRILSTADAAHIRERRRYCYQFLARELQQSTLGKALYPELAPGDTPYVFPFLLHDEKFFRAIRSAALPLYRWEEIHASGCPVSTMYRSHLVQLPCHQDLSDADLTLLVSRLQQIE